MRTTLFGLGAVLSAAAMLPAFAADAKISDVRFGDVLVGPKLKPEDLQGRVVLIELWGIR
jgi:hypothetical protein